MPVLSCPSCHEVSRVALSTVEVRGIRSHHERLSHAASLHGSYIADMALGATRRAADGCGEGQEPSASQVRWYGMVWPLVCVSASVADS